MRPTRGGGQGGKLLSFVFPIMADSMRPLIAIALLATLTAPPTSAAQRVSARATAADSARTDSAHKGSARADSARTLSQVRVTVTRDGGTTVQRAPWAVAVQTRGDLTRGQATLGIDEALNNVPGVMVANRYNYSVDQRLSIRGAGSRANFGIRGVKVLLDGVPQSLPDGQNQLTNVDLANVARAEVLRGSASSLYGNGSGGVIAFETDRSAPDPFGITARYSGGSYGMSKGQVRMSGRMAGATGSLSLSRTKVAGFRQFDSAEVRQVMSTADYSPGAGNTLELRASYADLPTSLNPGALTTAEYAKNRDSASATNIARYANKVLAQSQFSARLKHTGEANEWAVVAYVQRRFVDNPLATAPPGTTGAAIGTLSTLNRWVTGARVDVSHWWPQESRLPRLNAGVDVQRSLDIRRNWRVTAGKRTSATDTLFLDQSESVVALGPFASAQWSPTADVTISAGGRADQIEYAVGDRFLKDKIDNSATRTMRSTTGHLGASYVASRALTVYANVATAFETPTTTELSSRQDGAGGFNPDLGPQQIGTVETGVRGEYGRVTYSASAFRVSYRDAIVQYLESNGRAYFRNAGQTRNQGVEIGATAAIASWLDANVAWTESYYRFTNYRAPRTAAITDTLDGKRLAGVPDRFVRLGVRSRWRAATLDVDHTWSGTMFGDDRNTVKVADWGKGALNARLGWTGDFSGTRVSPFVAVNNAFNIAYVGSVNVNGAAGRVLEPAPLRNFYVGVETGWRVVR